MQRRTNAECLARAIVTELERDGPGAWLGHIEVGRYGTLHVLYDTHPPFADVAPGVERRTAAPVIAPTEPDDEPIRARRSGRRPSPCGVHIVQTLIELGKTTHENTLYREMIDRGREYDRRTFQKHVMDLVAAGLVMIDPGRGLSLPAWD